MGLWVGVFGVTSDNSFRKNGGDDETRTRDLCRDSETPLGFTGTYKLRRPPKSLQNLPNFESCGSGVDRIFAVLLPAKEVKEAPRLAGSLASTQTPVRLWSFPSCIPRPVRLALPWDRLPIYEATRQLAQPGVRAAETLFGRDKELSGIAGRRGCCNRTHCREHARILAAHKIHELANQVPVLTLFSLAAQTVW